MQDASQRTLVWDLPTRVFHWLLAASFAGAFLTAESERLRDVHLLLGYTAGGLIAFRLLWGVIGTRYARFTSLPLSPRAVVAYLKSLPTQAPQHYVGHNPAGSWAIVGLLAMIALLVASGWAVATGAGPQTLEEAHEFLGNAALALVLFHIAAAIVSSFIHRENLVRAMVTGFKRGAAPPAAGTRWLVALLLVGAVAAFLAGTVPVPGLESRPPSAHVTQVAPTDNPAAVAYDRRKRQHNEGESESH